MKLGYNYRITDFQCALGESQLKKLLSLLKEEELAKKRQVLEIPEINPIQQEYE